MSDFTILGKQVREPLKQVETFPKPPHIDEVTLVADEVTSLCPVTGQPDFETVTITYVPASQCIESKSLKLYLWRYREAGVFCEVLATQIRADIMEACQPVSCRVTVQQKPRGGIAITATAGEEKRK